MSVDKLTKEVKFYPQSKTSHDSSTIWFILKGKKGAITFWYMTGYREPKEFNSPTTLYYPMGGDFGYHTYKPQYDDQTTMLKCEFIGKDCYYDGSSLQARDLMKLLIEEGDVPVWKAMQERYEALK